MKSDKNSLVLLSSKLTKADRRTRADEAFALPSFPEATPVLQMELPSRSCKEAAMEHHVEKNLENLKLTMLQHESMFREQVRELHRLYQVQRLLMAESKGKDSAMHTSSDPPSSNNSLVHSSGSFKTQGKRSSWEATGGSKINVKQDNTDVVCKLEQITPSQGHIFVHRSQQDVQHPEGVSKSKYQKVIRRTFDLERPAEEYMDIEAENDKSFEESTLVKVTPTLDVSVTCRVPFGVSGKDTHLSPSAHWDKEVVGSAHREMYGNAKSSEKNGRQGHSLLKPLGFSEVSFSVMEPSSIDCPSNGVPVHSTPVISTKSLLGGLLGRPAHESQSEDQPMLILQSRENDEHHSRRGERWFDADAGARFTQENSKPPHWLLQAPEALTKTPPVNPLTNKSGWQQRLPFFLQKQDDQGMLSKLGFVPREKETSAVSLEISEGGNVWSSSGTNFNQGQLCALGSHGSPASGLSLSASTGQGSHKASHQVGEGIKQSILVAPPQRDEKGARVPPVCTSNHPSLSTVELKPPLLESHPAPMTFFPENSSRGAVSCSTTPPWFPQNSLMSLMHQQKAGGSLPLALLRPLLVPPHVGLVDAQPPAGNYEVQAVNFLGITKNFGESASGMLKVTDDASSSTILSAPATTRPEPSLKRPVFGSMPLTELTLGLNTSKLNETSNLVARDEDSSCVRQKVRMQDQYDGLYSMGESLNVKAWRQIGQPPTESYYHEQGSAGAVNKVFQQVIRTFRNTSSHEASSSKGPPLENPQIIQDGLNQNTTALGERSGQGSLPSDAVHVKRGVLPQRAEKPHQTYGPKVTECLKQEDNSHQESPQEHMEWQSAHDKAVVDLSTGEFNNGSSMKEVALSHTRQVTVSGMKYFDSGWTDTAIGVSHTGGISCMVDESLDLLAVTSCQIDVPVSQTFSEVRDQADTDGNSGRAHHSNVPGLVHLCKDENMVMALPSIMRSSEVAGKSYEEDLAVKTLNGSSISLTTHSSAVSKSHAKNDSVEAECEDHGDKRGARKQVDDISNDTKHAAKILWSLASDLSTILEDGVMQDYPECRQERSLEWFANLIPQEDEHSTIFGDAQTAGTVGPETTEGKISAIAEPRDDPSRYSEDCGQDRPTKVQYPRKLDFFESATLMLKASPHDTEELSSQVIDRCQIAGDSPSFSSHRGRSSRRGRGRKDFQREMLPSIASLSRQEINEDLQTIGGLMRSATEMVARRNASSCSLKESGPSPTKLGSTKDSCGTKGICMNGVIKSCGKDDTESQNGFLKVYSWGESTRRRRMQRHRSRWTVLPLGIGMSSS